MSDSQIKTGIINALCYSDIFDYPLRAEEIYKYYAGALKVEESILKRELNELVAQGLVAEKDGYYHLINREKIVAIRKVREIESRKKQHLAESAAYYVSQIPFVRFVGISGSLSVNNSGEDDDIDFFIMTSKNSLWITRFLVNVLLIVKGYKRSRGTRGANKICPNMFLSEDSMEIKKGRQNLFSAHEVVQLKPLVNKGGTYEKFLNENSWVLGYLPNTSLPRLYKKSDAKSFPVRFLEEMFFIAQYFYMMRRMTNEEVGLKNARFHPRDMCFSTLELYRIKRKEYLGRFEINKKYVRNVSEDTPGY